MVSTEKWDEIKLEWARVLPTKEIRTLFGVLFIAAPILGLLYTAIEIGWHESSVLGYIAHALAIVILGFMVVLLLVWALGSLTLAALCGISLVILLRSPAAFAFDPNLRRSGSSWWHYALAILLGVIIVIPMFLLGGWLVNLPRKIPGVGRQIPIIRHGI